MKTPAPLAIGTRVMAVSGYKRATIVSCFSNQLRTVVYILSDGRFLSRGEFIVQ